MRVFIETLDGYQNIKPNTWFVDTDTGELWSVHGKQPIKGSWSRSRKYNYRQVTLQTADGRKVHKRKCVIIALACVDGRTAERNQVDHINGTYDDDRPCNLRWVSVQENHDFRNYRRLKNESQRHLL